MALLPARESTVTTVYLIRHADALPREDWSEEDIDRPLTEKGQKQAQRLAKILAKSGITEFRTSPATRCRETAAPLAAALKLLLVVDPELSEGGAALRLRFAGPDYALCSHGDRIPATLDELGIKWEKCKKGSVWVVGFDKTGKIVKTDYLAPDDA
jgi:8-oxo-(d)GTP phosphatase